MQAHFRGQGCSSVGTLLMQRAQSQIKREWNWAVVAHAFNPSTQEAEAGGSL
ncbi:hypothetical protein LEMLEM_LOCUS12785 [Lemmus lemmus]